MNMTDSRLDTLSAPQPAPAGGPQRPPVPRTPPPQPYQCIATYSRTRRLAALLLAAALALCPAPRLHALGSPEAPAATEGAVPIPIIKLPHKVDQLHWSHDGVLFGYAEGNAVVVRDAATYRVRDVVRPSQNEVGGFVFSELLGSVPGLLSVSEGYSLGVSALGGDAPGTVVLPASDRDGAAEVTSMAFDDRSGYVAVGSSDGRLELSLYLQYIQDLSRFELRGHSAAVRTMRFSTDSQWLASLSEDGLLCVWDVRAHRLAGSLRWSPPVEFDGDSVISPFAVFGSSAPRLLLPVDGFTLEVRGLDGSSGMTLRVEEGVRGVRVNGDGTRADVLTGANRLYSYDLASGRRLGHVPLLSDSAVVSFALDPGERRLLVSHEDGSLVLLELEDVFVPEDGREGAYRLVLVGPDGAQRELLTLEDLREAGIDPSLALLNSYTAGPSVAGGPFHSVDLLVGTTFLPEPFVASLDVQVGYMNGFLLHPLYFGAQWRSSWGLPRRDFPYIYNGGEFGPPLLIDWVLELPVGLRLEPWGPGGAEVRVEVAAGFAMHELWNRELGARAVTAGLNSDHFHGAFVGGVAVGVGWRGLLLKASGEWDSEFGWTGQLSLGYSLRLPLPQRWRGGGGEGHGVFAHAVDGPVAAASPQEAVVDEAAADTAEAADAEDAAPQDGGVDAGEEVESESAGGSEPAAESVPQEAVVDVEEAADDVDEATRQDDDIDGADDDDGVGMDEGTAAGLRAGPEGVLEYDPQPELD